MSSSDDRFWSTVGRWLSLQSRIRITLERRFPQREHSSLIGRVSRVEGRIVTFLIEEGGDERGLDFTDADIRPKSFFRIDADEIVCSFGVIFPEDDPRESTRGTFTELREVGEPN
jgi:hypothetical protein